MSNRFAFLAREYNEIHQYCAFIDDVKCKMPSASLGQARNALEMLVSYVDDSWYKSKSIYLSIKDLRQNAMVPKNISELMDNIRYSCNHGGAHPDLVTISKVNDIINKLIEVCIWFVLAHEQKNYDISWFEKEDWEIVKHYKPFSNETNLNLTNDLKTEIATDKKSNDTNTIRLAEKAYEELLAKAEEVNKALEAVNEAQGYATKADFARVEAEKRAEEAERKMKLALDDKNKLQLLIYQRENELRNIYKEEKKKRAVPTGKENLYAEKKGSLVHEKKIIREKQLELWNSSGASDIAEDDIEMKIERLRKREALRQTIELKLRRFAEMKAESKKLARCISSEIKRFSYAKGKLSLSLSIQNKNDCEVRIGQIVFDVKLYLKSTGVKIYDAEHTVDGLVLDKASTTKVKYLIEDVKIFGLDGKFGGKAIDWDSVGVNLIDLVRN